MLYNTDTNIFGHLTQKNDRKGVDEELYQVGVNQSIVEWVTMDQSRGINISTSSNKGLWEYVKK